jgi:hypothetical protein
MGCWLSTTHRRWANQSRLYPTLWPGKSAITEWELELSRDYRARIDSMISIGDKSRDWETERLHMNLMVNEPHIPLTDLETISCPVMVMTSEQCCAVRELARSRPSQHVHECDPDRNTHSIE